MKDLVPANRPDDTSLQGRGQVGTIGQYSGRTEESPRAPGAGIGRLLAAIRRYKWLVIGVVVIGTASGSIATRYIVPEYRTSATIYIQNAPDRSGPIRANELLNSNSWVSLIRSYAVLDSVVLQNRLFLTHAPADSSLFATFGLADRFAFGDFKLKIDPTGRAYRLEREGVQVEAGQTGDSIGAKRLGFKWAPAPAMLGRDREIVFSVKSPRDASADILDRMKTAMPDDKGTFLNLTLRGSNPETITTTLNGIIDRFIAIAAVLKKDKLIRLRKDLEEQLAKADSAVRASEGGLESFKVRTITEPREDIAVASGLQQTQSTVVGNYIGLRQRLEATRTDRRAIEEVLRDGRAQGVVAVDAFHTIAAVKSAPELISILTEVATAEAELRALRNRYTDEYKAVKDLITKLDELKANTVPAAANRLVVQLKKQEAVIEAQIATQGDEMRQIPVRSMTESRLRRDADAAVGLYRELSGRYEEAKLAELSATPDVTILDRAKVPTTPASNTAPVIILMGIGGGMALGLALALVLDRLDRRFRYPEQAVNDLGLAILGAVPVIKRQKGGVMSPADTLQVVEAFRGIRLNIANSFGPAEPVAITVSSPSPGDGKSLLCSNLALSFAEAGYRTILIDGDTRRGELHRVFGVPKGRGLVDFLEGNASMSQIQSKTSHANLTVICSGQRSPRGPELLGSARMRELITHLRSEFTAIVIDSPPFQAGIDPFVLGTMVGNMVVVLRAGETDRQLAEAKLQTLDRLPIRLLGALLNNIEIGVGAYRYYAYEYGYGDESTTAAQAEALGPNIVDSEAAVRS